MEEIYKYKYVEDRTMFVYHINISDKDRRGGWYRQLTSIETLVSKIGKRWYNNFYLKSKDKRVFNRYDWEDGQSWLRINKYLEETDKYNIVNRYFDSVWDFYEYIGYDYKNKSVKQLDNLIMNWRN